MSSNSETDSIITVAYLGPAGSFSNAVARQQFPPSSNVHYEPCESIIAVFRHVESSKCHYGIIPYVNLIAGPVPDAIDEFMKTPVKILAETVLPITHNLMCVDGMQDKINRIYSHQMALKQCTQFLSKNFSEAQLIPSNSTSEAAGIVSRDKEPGAAAICNAMCVELYGLVNAFPDIADRKDNVTRFLTVALNSNSVPASNSGKCFIRFAVAQDEGKGKDQDAPCTGLQVLKNHSMNPIEVHSRQASDTLKKYFVECTMAEGCNDADSLESIMKELRETCSEASIMGKLE